MNFVFFIRAYNDLDCFTPIAFVLQEKVPDCRLIFINHAPGKNYENDFRIRYLKNRGSIFYLNATTHGVWKTISILRQKLIELVKDNRAIGSPYYRLIDPCLEAAEKQALKTFPMDCLPVTPDTPVVYFFDQSRAPILDLAIKHAKANKIPTVCLQHGLMPPASSTVLRYQSAHGNPFPGELAERADQVFVNNSNTAQALPSVSPSKLKILGMPRFCRKWTTILDHITPRTQHPDSAAKLRVLVVQSKWSDVIDKTEDLSNIRRLAAHPDITLTVKPHTRGMLMEELKDVANVYVARPEDHTRQLMQSADLIIFTMSSVFMDGLLLDKPMLHIRYTHNWELGCKDIIKHWNIDSADQLMSRVQQFTKDKSIRTYTPEEREACLTFYGGGNKDALNLFAKHILSLIPSD